MLQRDVDFEDVLVSRRRNSSDTRHFLSSDAFSGPGLRIASACCAFGAAYRKDHASNSFLYGVSLALLARARILPLSDGNEKFNSLYAMIVLPILDRECRDSTKIMSDSPTANRRRRQGE